MSEDKKDTYLSTSRLAKHLSVDGKALFTLLSEQNWISHEDDQWRLTAQGEYHGGKYQHSDKYGDYVVWPVSLADHAVLQSLDGLMVSATQLSRHYGVSAQSLNLLLANLGWIEKDQRGWMLTDLGSKLGAQMRTSKQGFFVLWPAGIRQNPLLLAAAKKLMAEDLSASLDGHVCRNSAEQRICNYLYLHGLVHAKGQLLPGQDFLKADFYLPQRRVFIDYWHIDDALQPLSIKLEKQDYYQKHGLKKIELGHDDMEDLDKTLSQKLLQFGVQCS